MTRLGKILDIDAVPQNPEDAADYWAAKRMLGTLTPREEARFLAWLDDPANASAYAVVDEVASSTQAITADPVVTAMRADALRAGPGARPSGWKIAAAVAASVVVVGVGVASLRAVESGRPDSVFAATEGRWVSAEAKRYETLVGERRDIRLDDGSVVSLNTGTIIEVAYTAAQRDVRLLQGQALFQVAPSARWPFIVAAGDRAITAVGTAFDVRLEGDDTRIVLVEGKIRVAPLQRQGFERLIPALGEEGLAEGQQLIATTNAPVVVNAADVARVTSWRSGQIIFRDDTIASAVSELNRYSDRPIIVADPRVAALKVSGVFWTERPEKFTEAVTALFPVEAAETGESTVLSWRGGV